MPRHSTLDPPDEIRNRLPSMPQLIVGLSDECVVIERGMPLFRAARSLRGIVPERGGRAQRFGPPPALTVAGGELPFWWLYAAFEPDTAIWEARFCLHDMSRPGTFYLDRTAERDGLIATLRFPCRLRLWNLNGEASSRLGVFDSISSPDYAWCQWFGVRLHTAIAACDAARRPHGIVYPSRRHRGRAAIALSCVAVDTMRAGVRLTHQRFVDHEMHRRLAGDPLRVEPPAEAWDRFDR